MKNRQNRTTEYKKAQNRVNTLFRNSAELLPLIDAERSAYRRAELIGNRIIDAAAERAAAETERAAVMRNDCMVLFSGSASTTINIDRLCRCSAAVLKHALLQDIPDASKRGRIKSAKASAEHFELSEKAAAALEKIKVKLEKARKRAAKAAETETAVDVEISADVLESYATAAAAIDAETERAEYARLAPIWYAHMRKLATDGYDKTALLDWTERKQVSASAETAARIDTPTKARKLARAERAAAFARPYVSASITENAIRIALTAILMVERQDSTNATTLEKCAAYRRDVIAYRGRATNYDRVDAERARAERIATLCDDIARQIRAESAHGTNTERAKAAAAAAVENTAAHLARAEAKAAAGILQRFDAAAAGDGAELVQAAALAFAEISAETCADILFDSKGNPFCAWSKAKYATEHHIKAQRSVNSKIASAERAAEKRAEKRAAKQVTITAAETETAAERAAYINVSALKSALATLDNRSADICLRIARGDTIADIAADYSISQKYVRALYAAALRTLKTTMQST